MDCGLRRNDGRAARAPLQKNLLLCGCPPMVPPLRRGDGCVPSPVGTGEGQGGGNTLPNQVANFHKGRG